MALRDQPYLPLYVQDIMTDEKLNECCAATHGIYIKGIMCLMHKSETYGKLLLKQKFKQTSNFCLNFATQLAKHLPYSIEEISSAIEELVREGVCFFDGDFLCQKRMIRDNEISELRSLSGKKGGEKTALFAKKFAQAKNKANNQANSEYENENENTFEEEKEKGKRGMGKKPILALIPTSWPQDEFLATWAEFVEIRKKLKKPLTDAAIKRAVNKLVALSGGDWQIAKLIIDQSVDHSYDSFYPLKGTNGQASFNHPVTGQAPPHGKGYDRQGRLWPLVGGRLIDEA